MHHAKKWIMPHTGGRTSSFGGLNAPLSLHYPSFTHKTRLTIAPTRPRDPATRAQALAIVQLGCPIEEIISTTGFDPSSITRIKKRAKDRGYDPEKDKKIIFVYVGDAAHASKPKRLTPEVEQEVIEAISKNSTTRQFTTRGIANLVRLQKLAQ